MKELLLLTCLFTLTNCSKPDLVKPATVSTPAPTPAPSLSPAKPLKPLPIVEVKKSPEPKKSK